MQINLKPPEIQDKTYVLELTSTEIKKLINEIRHSTSDDESARMGLLELASLLTAAFRRFE